MHCSTSFSFSKPQILASLSGNNSPTPPRPPPNANPRPPQHALTGAAAEQEQIRKLQKRKRKQPSVAEIERAIGAGMFKDRDTSNRYRKPKFLFFWVRWYKTQHVWCCLHLIVGAIVIMFVFCCVFLFPLFRNAEKNKTLFDRFLSITIGETEGSVEKKLRESGEWIIDRTEKAPKSTGIFYFMSGVNFVEFRIFPSCFYFQLVCHDICLVVMHFVNFQEHLHES